LKRAGFAGVCCAVAIAAAQVANAAGTQRAKAIQTTQRIAILSSSGSKLTLVGTSDGKIAGASVRGALRAMSTSAGPPKFVATGTLFYAAGTLRYTLNGTATGRPDGSLSLSGTGRFTGGTGMYTGAHGNFTGSGTKPANSFETFTFKGKVSYR
jgi:peptidoglycan hydrolase-like protein with peptidoglycan-binding domain